MACRVLHLLWDGNLGGVQRYVLNVAGAPGWGQDWTHGICVFSRGGAVLSAETYDGYFHELGLHHGWQLAPALGLRAVCKAFQPDVVHCHCDTPAFSVLARLCYKGRLVYTEHGDTLVRSQRRWATRLIWNLRGGQWDAVLLISNYARTLFLEQLPRLAPVCSVLPNPLLDPLDPAECPPPESLPVIGFFGRINENKGLHRLLQALPEVCKAVGNTELRVFGEGPDQPRCEQLAAALNMADHVVFRGYTGSALDEMSRCAVVAVPSRIEAFGLVALEALSAGTPVVAFRGNGVEELVSDGKTGRMVAQDDIAGMAAALAELLLNPGRATAMGEAGRAWACSRFSLSNHIAELKQVYAPQERTQHGKQEARQ